jgi:hypothetical protein
MPGCFDFSKRVFPGYGIKTGSTDIGFRKKGRWHRVL